MADQPYTAYTKTSIFCLKNFRENGKEPKNLRLASFFTGCLKNILGVPGYKVSSKVEIHRIYQHSFLIFSRLLNVQVKIIISSASVL